jgi:ATP-dependent DNA helicase RecG
MTNKNFILNLLKKGESEKVEFKASFDQATIETLAAFANTKGGHVIIGVTDAGKINGVQLGKETIQQWINQIKANTVPSLVPDATTITIDHKEIVLFIINELPVKPVSCRGKYLKRTKNSNHQMTIHEISNLHLRSYQASWDYYIDQNHIIDDISLSKVNKFIELSNLVRSYPISDDPMTVLKKYELIKEKAITNGCYLLFAMGDVILSTIEVGRFSQDTIIQDGATIRSDLFSEVDTTLDFIRKHLNKSYIITGDKQRQERWDYPLESLREIVINMIVHRDYTVSTDSVIKIFTDRIEFYNPGGLMGGLTIEQLLRGNYISAIRNKQIATLFKEAGIIEKYGSGIKRIIEAIRSYKMPEPLFEEIQNGFRVTVFKATQKAAQKTTQKTTQKKSTRERVIEELKLNSKITREELATLLGKSQSTIKEHLSRLKAAGRVVRVGSDRDGYWKVQ